jgi:DNA-binding beta-propeller fold protein YncE
MLRFPLLWLLSASLAYSALAHLPNTGINAIKVDLAGNIYVAGYQGTAGAMATYDAFVAKLSPGGSKVLFSTKLGGSRYDEALALDLDSSGAAYVFGRTQSSDFPATPGALQTTLASGLIQGFVAKLDAQGNVIYATSIGGNSNIFATPASLVVDGAGEAIVSASTDGETFPTPTSGLSTGTTPNFVLKLDSTGSKLLGAVRGIGGLLALDSQGNVYIAGSEAGETIPVTPGAFQPSAPFLILCGGSGRFPGVCSNQYVTKLDATLNQTIFSTYLTGTFGATPAPHRRTWSSHRPT